MRTTLRATFLIFLFLAIGLLSGQAQTAGVSFPDTMRAWTVNELPMPHLQDSLRYTVNPDMAMSRAEMDSLDLISQRLNREFGIEMVCVAVAKVAGDDVYEWGDSLFTKYGFGKKEVDNGLLIVISVLDREWHIFTGKGLEGVLPDAACNRIGNRAMMPFLKEQRWGAAMIAAANAVYGVISSDPDSAEYTNFEEDSYEDLGGALGIIGTIALGVGGIAYLGRKKCPQCKAYLKVQNRVLVSRIGTVKYYDVTYVCPKCGHTFTEREKVDLAPSATAGSAFGGSFGGGGGGGGSFGGGSFGGGGAGGRF